MPTQCVHVCSLKSTAFNNTALNVEPRPKHRLYLNTKKIKRGLNSQKVVCFEDYCKRHILGHLYCGIKINTVHSAFACITTCTSAFNCVIACVKLVYGHNPSLLPHICHVSCICQGLTLIPKTNSISK